MRIVKMIEQNNNNKINLFCLNCQKETEHFKLRNRMGMKYVCLNCGHNNQRGVKE